MYTINMADSTGLFIILMIFCVMSITSSILFTYTCTDGTWDFDNFEGEQCVKFPEKDKTDPACTTFTTQSDCPLRCSWDTTTSLCGEPPSTNNPQNVTYGYGTYTSSLMNGTVILPKSEHFTTCSTMFFINETTTCFNKGANSAAIKWVFTNTDNTNTCLSKISYFRVYVSFSSNENALYYVDKAPSDRHFHFKGAPSDTLMSQGGDNTITFTVHAMDINNKILAGEVKKSVIANDSAETCTNMGVGTAENWSDTMKVYVQGASEPEPTKNCEGGTYVTDISYGCKNSSGTYNLIDVEANICGPSCYIKQDLVGYTPPTGGGSCLLTKYPFKERTSCNAQASQEDLNSITDCILSDAVPAPFTDNSEPFNAIGMNGSCSKACGTEGVQRQVQRVAVDERNTGKACSEKVTEVACNRIPCGRDCKGTLVASTHDKANERCVISDCSGDCQRGTTSHSATNYVRKFNRTIEQIVGPIVTNELSGTTRQSKTCEERYGDNTKRFEGLFEENQRDTDPNNAWHSCKCKGIDESDCDNSRYSSWTGYVKAGVADQAGTLDHL